MPAAFEINDVSTIIRRKLNINKDQSLYLMVNDGKTLLTANTSLRDAFEKYKDEDGFMYILYTEENIFG